MSLDLIREAIINNEIGQEIVKSQRPPPAGTAVVDNQGTSETCVRFAIAKAIANLLFVKKRINVEQNQIMNCLVQVKKSIAAIHPKVYKGLELFLQDIENDFKDINGVKIPDKSWWKVRFSLIRNSFF